MIGGILLDNNALDRAVELMQRGGLLPRGAPQDLPRHARPERAARAGRPGDAVRRAALANELQDVGGAAYLAELVERVPTAANVAHYARIVKDKAILRALIQTTSEIAMRGYEAPPDVEQLPRRGRAPDLRPRRAQDAAVVLPRASDIVVESMKAVEQLYERQELVTGVPTGFADLDKKTAGLQPGDLIIVAGRPSMGKTAFALNIAQHAALEAKTGVAVFSLEMSKEQLVFRMLCSEARVDQSKVRAGYAASKRLSEAGDRRRSALGGADLHRRHAGARRARAARQGAPAEARARGQPRPGHRRLPAAHDAARRATAASRRSPASRARSRRWPRSSSVPVIALSQLNRAGRGARRQAAAAVRPARVRRHRAGRRRDHVPLPRRGSTTRRTPTSATPR